MSKTGIATLVILIGAGYGMWVVGGRTTGGQTSYGRPASQTAAEDAERRSMFRDFAVRAELRGDVETADMYWRLAAARHDDGTSPGGLAQAGQSSPYGRSTPAFGSDDGRSDW